MQYLCLSISSSTSQPLSKCPSHCDSSWQASASEHPSGDTVPPAAGDPSLHTCAPDKMSNVGPAVIIGVFTCVAIAPGRELDRSHTAQV